MRRITCILLVCCLLPLVAAAQLRLPSVIGDGMVLQTQQLRSSVGQSSSLVTGAYSCRMGRRACRGKRFTRRRLERRNSDHRGRRALYDRDHIRNGTTHIAKRVAGRGLDMCRTIEHVDARSRLRKPAHRRIARSDRLLTVLSDPHVYGRPNRFRTQRVQRQRPLDGSRCRHNGSFQRRGLFLRTYTLPSTERSGRHDQPKLGRLHGSSLVQPGTAHAVPEIDTTMICRANRPNASPQPCTMPCFILSQATAYGASSGIRARTTSGNRNSTPGYFRQWSGSGARRSAGESFRSYYVQIAPVRLRQCCGYRGGETPGGTKPAAVTRSPIQVWS